MVVLMNAEGLRAFLRLAAFSTILILPQLVRAQPLLLDRFRACLAIDDMTKERLDCFDAIVRPEPKPSPARPGAISDCRFYQEEDERLKCFNSFVARAPSTPRAPQPTAQQVPNERFRPCYAMNEMTRERLECFDKIVPPAPRAFTAQPRSVFECRFYPEQDDRLRCYINFTARIFRTVQHSPSTATPPRAQLPEAAKKPHRVARTGCGSRGGAGYRTRSGKCASRKR
jgi:hypothetical protein